MKQLLSNYEYKYINFFPNYVFCFLINKRKQGKKNTYQNMQYCTPLQNSCLAPQMVSHCFPGEGVGPKSLLNQRLTLLFWQHRPSSQHLPLPLLYSGLTSVYSSTARRPTSTCSDLSPNDLSLWSQTGSHTSFKKWRIALGPQTCHKTIFAISSNNIQLKSLVWISGLGQFWEKQIRADLQILAVEKKKVNLLQNRVAMFAGKSKKMFSSTLKVRRLCVLTVSAY